MKTIAARIKPVLAFLFFRPSDMPSNEDQERFFCIAGSLFDAIFLAVHPKVTDGKKRWKISFCLGRDMLPHDPGVRLPGCHHGLSHPGGPAVVCHHGKRPASQGQFQVSQ